VENNSYIDNNRSYLNLWESTADFRYNDVRSDGVAIENSGRSNLSITYNNIESTVGVKTYHTNNWYNLPNAGWTSGGYNNFSPSQYAVQSEARYYNNGESFPLDFRNNFFNTTSQDEIEALIYDVHDLPEPYTGSNWAIVNYLPFRTSSIPNAGIQSR
jgi:hypothetical protein